MIAYQETSRQAWQEFVPVAAELDRLIMGALMVAPMTCEGIETAIGRSHQSVSANLRHLVERGLVEKSGDYEKVKSGRRANVWWIVGSKL